MAFGTARQIFAAPCLFAASVIAEIYMMLIKKDGTCIGVTNRNFKIYKIIEINNAEKYQDGKIIPQKAKGGTKRKNTRLTKRDSRFIIDRIHPKGG